MNEVLDTLFYDGKCGLCHRTVRFVVRFDGQGRFRFAPLGGELFGSMLDEEARRDLPDSFVVVSREGALLTRSAATVYVGRRLGGVWRTLAVVAGVVPRSLADAAYDLIASMRSRLFAKPTSSCPIVPTELRGRFFD